MRQVLISAFGSVGDVLPFIGIGSELRKRGHDITLIGNPYFEAQAEEAGLVMSPVGTIRDYHELMTDSRVFHWRSALDPSILSHFVHIVEPAYKAIAGLYKPGRTVLFASGASTEVWIAVEKCGIPFVGGVVSPNRLPSRYDPPHPPRPLPSWATPLARTRTGLRLLHGAEGTLSRLTRFRRYAPSPPSPANPLLSEINRVRTSLQLAAIEAAGTTLPPPQRIVCMWPDWFAHRQRDWPAGAQLTGFPFYSPAPEEVQLAEKDRNGADHGKPLVFTTGSVACQQQAFFAAAVEACRILRRPGLLVTPHADQIPAQLPADVKHAAYAPFGPLFARSALVVHHGGVGTIALALAAGVPQIIRPMMGDQFDLGNRLQRLGVGRMITAKVMDAPRLARAIDSLLQSERVSRQCRYWQTQIDRQAGLTRAADSIESLIG